MQPRAGRQSWNREVESGDRVQYREEKLGDAAPCKEPELGVRAWYKRKVGEEEPAIGRVQTPPEVPQGGENQGD